ncbi:MAG: hypothetical protein ACKN9V_05160 [Pseudomonadota bacterium]
MVQGPKAIFFVFILLFHFTALAGSGGHCPESFEKLTGLIGRNFFETRRDFEKYAELFPASFLSDVSRLKSDGHWIDAGSGEGFALQDLFNQTVIDPPAVLKNAEATFWRKRRILLDPEQLRESAARLNFREPEDKPKVTGITYKMDRSDPKIPNLFIKTGRFFEDIPLGEFSQADIISDLYGVISYTPRLDEVLKRYHTLLKDSGRVYIFIGDYLSVPEQVRLRRFERAKEAGWYSPFVKSTVRKADGSVVSLLDWVASLPGFRTRVEFVEIQETSRAGFVPGTIERSTLVLEKRSDQSFFPTLRLMESDEGKPPTRKFQEVSQ